YREPVVPLRIERHEPLHRASVAGSVLALQIRIREELELLFGRILARTLLVLHVLGELARRSAVIAGEVERLHVDRADRLVGAAVLEVARGDGRRLAVLLERVVLARGSGEQLPAIGFGSGG